MKIKFPFNVKQVSATEIEVEMSHEGRPLLNMQFHPSLARLIPEKVCNDIYAEALGKFISACLRVTFADET